MPAGRFVLIPFRKPRCTCHFLVLWLLLAGAIAAPALAEDWLRFRGPNGTGIAGTQNLPVDFSPEQALWVQEVPSGKSSPIVVDGRVIVTGATDTELLTAAFDAVTGQPRWRRAVPRLRHDEIFVGSGPSVATPVSDGDTIYSFFPEFGLVSYSVEGEEQWRAELPPFDSLYGLTSSPVLEGDVILLQCDQPREPFLLGVDKNNGELVWRQERTIGESWSTPAILHPGSDSAAVLTVGSLSVDAYAVRTGEHLFTVPGLGYIPIASPAVDGNRIYVSAPDGAGDAAIPATESMFTYDADESDTLSPEELGKVGLAEHFDWLDRNGDQTLTRAEYAETEGLYNTDSFGIVAIDLSRSVGDQIAWREQRAVPYIASPILYKGVLFAVKDGGILTSLDAETGEVLKRARIKGAVEPFYPSPIIADERLYFTSSNGTIAVVSAVADWELLHLSEIDERVDASPAVADGRIFVRTQSRLLAFEAQKSK